MFNFRLINTSDGNQVIDTSLKTPYEALTALQMIEYIEVDNQLTAFEISEWRKKKKNNQRFFGKIIDKFKLNTVKK